MGKGADQGGTRKKGRKGALNLKKVGEALRETRWNVGTA